LEDLEKELNENCDCSEDVDCVDNRNCVEDDNSCNQIDCEEQNQSKEDEHENNISEESSQSDNEQSVCEESESKEGNVCEEEINHEQECDEESKDNDKCKCGCGDDAEDKESISNAYFNQLLTLRAEFDNYRKRTQNDVSQAYKNGFNQAITEFLPALDSFKMATEYITDPNTLMGIQYIEKGILATLEKMGITVIDTTGKFDHNFHQAIGSEESDEHESGDIIKECFKGFKIGDKIIRYSQVIVAK